MLQGPPAYQGCLLHGSPAPLIQGAPLPLLHGVPLPLLPPTHRAMDWQAHRRRVLQAPSSYYMSRDAGLEEVAREQGRSMRAARHRYFSDQEAAVPRPVRRSASTSLPRKWSAPLPPRAASRGALHRHSVDLGGLDVLTALPVPGGRVRPRDCDELPEEFRRAGIGVCFGGDAPAGSSRSTCNMTT